MAMAAARPVESITEAIEAGQARPAAA